MVLPVCIVIGCVNATHSQNTKYYQIPSTNQNVCKQWYINTLREDLQPSIDHYVCIEHFDEESFLPIHATTQNNLDRNQLQLKEDAVPSLFEIEVFQKMITHQELVSNRVQTIDYQTIETPIHQITTTAISGLGSQASQATSNTLNSTNTQQTHALLSNLINGKTTNYTPIPLTTTTQSSSFNKITSVSSTSSTAKCSIATCQNHQLNNNIELFPLPKIADIAKKWQSICHIYDDSIKLCRLHFLKSDFNEYNFLKPDAIPSVFDNSLTTISSSSSSSSSSPSANTTSIGMITTTTSGSSSSKRYRMDPNERAELMSRVPKAVKRTTVQQQQLNNTSNSNNNQQSKIQKAIKHTNSVLRTTTTTPSSNTSSTSSLISSQQQTYNGESSRYLSAALINSPSITVSPTSSSTTTATIPLTQQPQQLQANSITSSSSSSSTIPITITATTTSPSLIINNINSSNNNNNNKNKVQKAVKHTTANSLLKDILPPPIMQSTKRAPKAVKHTMNLSNVSTSPSLSSTPSSSSSIFISSNNNNNTTTSTLCSIINSSSSSSSHKLLTNTMLNINNTTTNGNNKLNNIQNNDQNNISTINGNGNMTNGNQIQHKTTYVYKRISQAPEIELYLECEEDDLTEIQEDKLFTSTNNVQNKIKEQLTPSPPKRRSIDSSSPPPHPTSTSTTTTTTKLLNQILNTTKPTPTPITRNNSNNSNNLNNIKTKQQQQQTNQTTNTNDKNIIKSIIFKYYNRQEGNYLNDEQLKSGKYPGKCNICDKIIDNNIDLISHICAHLEGETYISPFDAVTTCCSVCDMDFDNPFELIKHLDIEHMKQLNEFKCRICERPHKSLNELVEHLNSTHSHNEMPYHCDACSFRTSFYADAIYHIKTQHLNTLIHFCPYCLKSLVLPYGEKVQHIIVTNYYSHLITHFNKHEDNELIQSKCKHCSKCLLHVRHIKEHLINDHKINISTTDNSNSDNKLENSFNKTKTNIINNNNNNDNNNRLNIVRSSSNNELLNDCLNKLQKATKTTTYNSNNHNNHKNNLFKNSNNSIFGINKRFIYTNTSNNNNNNKYYLSPSNQNDPFDMFTSIDEEYEDKMSIAKNINYKFIFGKHKTSSKCLECGDNDLSSHFKHSYACHQCRYGTFCSKSFEYHLHQHLASKRNALWNKDFLDTYEYNCECSFKTDDGNKMALHLLDCDKKACLAKSVISIRIVTNSDNDNNDKSEEIKDVEMKDE